MTLPVWPRAAAVWPTQAGVSDWIWPRSLELPYVWTEIHQNKWASGAWMQGLWLWIESTCGLWRMSSKKKHSNSTLAYHHSVYLKWKWHTCKLATRTQAHSLEVFISADGMQHNRSIKRRECNKIILYMTQYVTKILSGAKERCYYPPMSRQKVRSNESKSGEA